MKNIGKLEIQELIFPKGIVCDRKISGFRTPEINQVALVMSQLSKKIDPNKKADSNPNCYLSAFVPGGLDLSNFINDFQALRILMKSRS